METNKNEYWNVAMLWGLYISLAIIAITLLYYLSGNFMSRTKGILEYVIYAAGIIMSAKAYKNALIDKKKFTYGHALGHGVATMLFSSIVLALFTFVFYTYAAPGLIDEMLLFTEEKLLNSGLSDNMIEQQIEMQRLVMKPVVLSIGGIFGVVFIGLIISLITSIFLREKPASGFDAAMSEIKDEN